MEFRVVWTEFAQNRLKSIYNYYRKKASKTVAERLTNQIYLSVKPLVYEPFIGQVEESLIEYEQGFRYYIVKNYKVIYWVTEETRSVIIADVFDGRRNPERITDFITK